nr:MAG TPA: hypothetical protein [Caudoviricetes sp.]
MKITNFVLQPINFVLYKSRERTPILIFFVMMSLIG